ncbi:GTA-gp10 family protein [Hyphomonas sp.]|uniref:GTA-gp10 family protein n=1 Tax=Hyphomonas sp. TaxID=87 RepID=UPI003919114C
MNAARGEASVNVAGVPRRLCLTLGALAEIEAAFGCVRISELEARLRMLSAADLVTVLAALLRGGGETDVAAAVTRAEIAPGEAARAVADAFRLGLAG